MSTAATEASAPPAPATWAWVRGPWFDGFFLMSGLWLAPIALLIGARGGDPKATPLDDIYLLSSALFWIGHRFSSGYLAFFTNAYRPLLKSQRTRFVWAPIAITAAVCLFLIPGEPWPWPRTDRVMWLAMADFFFSGYHFASQHYGVLTLYRLRAGQSRTPRSRHLDRAFALGVGGALLLVVDAVVETEFFETYAPTLLGTAGAPLRRIGTVLVVAWTAAMLWGEAKDPRASAPRTLYLLSIALMVLCAVWVHPFIYIMLWTTQHWTAATGLALLVARDEPPPADESRWYRLWHVINRRPAALLVFLMAVSTVMLPVMEAEAVSSEADRYGARILPWLADALASPGIVTVLVALGFSSALLHYHFDRAVFRFSHPEVRKAARGALSPSP